MRNPAVLQAAMAGAGRAAVVNLAPNSRMAVDTAGWTGGTATFDRVTDLVGMPVVTGARVTGAGYIRTPTGVAAPGKLYTVSAYLRNGTGGFRFAGPLMYLGFTRSAGGDVFPESVSQGQFDIGDSKRVSFTASAVAPALTTGIFLILDALVAGMEASAVMYEEGSTLDLYVDGQ